MVSDKIKAAEIAQQALSICINKNSFLEAKSYSAIAASERYNVSMETLLNNDSVTIKKATEKNNKTVLFNAMYDYTNDLIAFNLLEKAATSLKSTINIASGINDANVKSRTLFLEGLFTFKIPSDLPNTENQFRQSLALAQQQNNAYLTAYNKLWIFETRVFEGKFDSTIKLAFEALDFFQKNNYTDAAADCETMIGDSYRNQGNEVKAIEFFTKAYPLAINSKNYIIAIRLKGSLSYVYFVNNDLKALDTTIISLNNYANIIASPFFSAVANAYTGRYYSWKHSYDTANVLFEKTEVLANSINSYKALGMVYAFKAEMFAKQNKNNEADSMSAKAYMVQGKTLSSQLINNIYKTIDDTSGNHLSMDSKLEKRLYTDSAFAASKGAAVVKSMRHGGDTIEVRPIISTFDSSMIVLYNNQLVDYETQYKTKQKDDSLKIERQQTIIASQNIRKQNLIIGGVTIIALLLAIGFYLQYKSRQRAQKDKAKIELLQNEIHHRVKNNFSSINRFIEVAEKSGSKNFSLHSLQNRIAAIELLHKNLYQSSTKGSVLLQTYLKQLVQFISNTFNNDDEKIKIIVNTPVQINMQTAEKIGLILNELLTNSFKYGFNNKTKGQINIVTNKKNNNSFILSYIENGVGYDKNSSINGYGSKLIEGIANEISNDFYMETKNGFNFNITINQS